MIYVLNKNDFSFIGRYDSIKLAKEYLSKFGVSEDDCIFTEDCNVDYISSIVMVDGSYIYNNPSWWTTVGPSLLNDYSNHKVYDIFELNKPEDERISVTLDRYKRELYTNINRINAIDNLVGQAGEVNYDMEIGKEFISLFRQECINTEFDRSTGVIPMTILAKVEDIQIPRSILFPDDTSGTYIKANIVTMLYLGMLKEVSQIMTLIENDVFLTPERITKYINMLNAADAIDYSTK